MLKKSVLVKANSVPATPSNHMKLIAFLMPLELMEQFVISLSSVQGTQQHVPLVRAQVHVLPPFMDAADLMAQVESMKLKAQNLKLCLQNVISQTIKQMFNIVKDTTDATLVRELRWIVLIYFTLTATEIVSIQNKMLIVSMNALMFLFLLTLLVVTLQL
jgi:hypothetical protein